MSVRIKERKDQDKRNREELTQEMYGLMKGALQQKLERNKTRRLNLKYGTDIENDSDWVVVENPEKKEEIAF